MLDHQDRKRIVLILAQHPSFQTARSRKQLFDYAGLQSITRQIDLEGSPFVVASESLQLLESFGRIQFDFQALGVFLSTFREFLGDFDDASIFIEEVLSKYSLMIPEKKQESVTQWKVGAVSNFQEKIIGENTLKPVNFLLKAVEAAKMVAFISLPGWTGTGFMISQDLLITNNHVVPTQEKSTEAIFKFNYQLDLDGREAKAYDFTAKPQGRFHTSSALDFSIIELEGSPGKVWGYANCAREVLKGSRVNIIQHPAGMPKHVSLQNNILEYVDDNIVQYLTSTMPGSSGAPVFDDTWGLFAVHHAGGLLMEPKTGKTYFRNEGIRISAILKSIPKNVFPELFNDKHT